MNDQDCSTVYDELVEILYQLKLGWVVEQVTNVISAGKTIEETVSGRKSPDLKLSYHTPKEQLLLLINSIEQAVVNTVEIELEVTQVLQHEMTASEHLKPEIQFVSSFDKTSKPLQFPMELMTSRQAQVQRLRDLLNSLQQEVIGDVN